MTVRVNATRKKKEAAFEERGVFRFEDTSPASSRTQRSEDPGPESPVSEKNQKG